MLWNIQLSNTNIDGDFFPFHFGGDFVGIYLFSTVKFVCDCVFSTIVFVIIALSTVLIVLSSEHRLGEVLQYLL